MKQKGIVKPHALLSKLAKFLLLLVLAGIFVSVLSGVVRVVSSGDRVKNAREQLAEAKRKQEELKTQVEEVNSDFYREKVYYRKNEARRFAQIIDFL